MWPDGATAAVPMISSTCARTRLEREPHEFERPRRDAVALVDQAEQDVLGADVVVVQQARLLLGEDDHPPGPVGEAFEHARKATEPWPAVLGNPPVRLPRRSRRFTSTVPTTTSTRGDPEQEHHPRARDAVGHGLGADRPVPGRQLAEPSSASDSGSR